MEILLATHNKNKIIEIKNALQELDIEILSLDDYPDMPDVIEDGDTLDLREHSGEVSRLLEGYMKTMKKKR